MKHSANTLRSGLKNFAAKLFFCSQLVIISLALPSLYYVGVSHNNDAKQSKKHLIITNKGKKMLASDEKGGDAATIKYSPAFMKI